MVGIVVVKRKTFKNKLLREKMCKLFLIWNPTHFECTCSFHVSPLSKSSSFWVSLLPKSSSFWVSLISGSCLCIARNWGHTYKNSWILEVGTPIKNWIWESGTRKMSWISKDNMTLFFYFLFLHFFKQPKSSWNYMFNTWFEYWKVQPLPLRNWHNGINKTMLV